MSDINDLTQRIINFRDDRNWKQFHNPKDVSLALVLEAVEVMEHFRFKNLSQVKTYIKQNKEAISEELADVLYFVLLMSHDLGIDIRKALERKMDINDKKYSLEKAKSWAQKGIFKKYTELS